MTKRRYVIAQLALIGLSSAGCLTGCAILSKRAVRSSSDRAFIDYWPPENNEQLSLAVKDNINKPTMPQQAAGTRTEPAVSRPRFAEGYIPDVNSNTRRTTGTL